MRPSLLSVTKNNWTVLAFAICSGAIVGYLLGITVFKKFKSEAVLSAAMSVEEYKRVSEGLGAAPDISARIAAAPQLGDDAEKLKTLFRNGAAKWHEPIPRVTKAEAKDLPDILLKLEFERDRQSDRQSDAQQVYSGVRLSATSRDALQSARIVYWLGNYFRDAAAKEALRKEVFDWKADNEKFISESQQQRFELKFEADQSISRAGALRKVLTQYPDLAKEQLRSVVDVRKENEKFVSPSAQLMAAEVEAIDYKERLSRIDRQLAQANFITPYLIAAEKAHKETVSGEAMIERLSSLMQDAANKAESDALREVVASKLAKISAISVRYLSRAQFIVPPSVPERPEAPRPSMLAALGAALLGLMTAAWLFREWIWAALKTEDQAFRPQ